MASRKPVRMGKMPRALAKLGMREIGDEEAASFPLHGTPEPPSANQAREFARQLAGERALGAEHPAFSAPVIEPGDPAMAMPTVVPKLVKTARGTIHVAAQVVSQSGTRGPLLSAEGCQFDDAVAEFELHETPEGADWCEVCAKPFMKED